MEDDHRSLFWSQPAEGVVEVVSRGDGASHVRRCRRIDLENPDAGIPTPLATCLGVAGVDDEAVKPRVETVEVAEGGEIAPGTQQSLLGGILGSIRVAEDPECERVTAVDDGCRE